MTRQDPSCLVFVIKKRSQKDRNNIQNKNDNRTFQEYPRKRFLEKIIYQTSCVSSTKFANDSIIRFRSPHVKPPLLRDFYYFFNDGAVYINVGNYVNQENIFYKKLKSW